MVEVQPCGTANTNCEEKDSYICRQPPMRGDCGEPEEIRFYYSNKEGRCGMFLYSGCTGSKNVFSKYEDCQATCESKFKISFLKIKNLGSNFPEQNSEDDDLRPNSLVDFDQLKEKTNCEISPWKYTPCNATCGEGYRWKYRQIIVSIKS